MRKHLFLSLVFSALSLTTALSQYVQPPQISVTGSAEVKVVPDEIRISVGVETRDAELAVAKGQHDERMASVLKFLKANGVIGKDMQTDYINVSPEYGNDLSRTKPVVYVVRKSIQLKLTTVTNLEPVLTGLLSSGVNHIYNVDFKTTQLRKYRDQARAMAVQAAKEKAGALAKELGVKCGKPSSINANEGGGYCGGQNIFQNWSASSDSADDMLPIGQISVSASVNASFLIE